jgi:hypothetical protein
MKVTEAHRALLDTEAAVAAAQTACSEAADAVDRALAEVGWRRLIGAFAAGSVPLYTNILYPGATLDLAAVLGVLERQKRMAAA